MGTESLLTACGKIDHWGTRDEVYIFPVPEYQDVYAVYFNKSLQYIYSEKWRSQEQLEKNMRIIRQFDESHPSIEIDGLIVTYGLELKIDGIIPDGFVNFTSLKRHIDDRFLRAHDLDFDDYRAIIYWYIDEDETFGDETYICLIWINTKTMQIIRRNEKFLGFFQTCVKAMRYYSDGNIEYYIERTVDRELLYITDILHEGAYSIYNDHFEYPCGWIQYHCPF